MRLKRSDLLSFRREGFGGILFHRGKGMTLELDREGYRLLELCDGSRSYPELEERLTKEFGKSFSKDMDSFVGELMALGMIEESFESEPGLPQEDPFAAAWPAQGHLSAPETVHWAITYRCSLDCSYCYVKKELADREQEMEFAEAKAFIDILHSLKVFQLAIGGGEPTLREDLPEIVNYAYRRGIVPNITTNGLHLAPETLRRIAGKIGRLQISFDLKEPLERYRGSGTWARVLAGIKLVAQQGIPFGINLLLTKHNIEKIADSIALCHRLGAGQVTILRPKPSARHPDWHLEESPTPEQYRALRRALDHLVHRYPQIGIDVDCALSFLMKEVPPAKLARRGVYGCRAGERFIVVLPNGDIYPCSHLVDHRYLVGNILSDDFKSIWDNSPALQRLRGFRDHRDFLRTACGGCEVKEHCGGCRAIAGASGDLYGEERVCRSLYFKG